MSIEPNFTTGVDPLKKHPRASINPPHKRNITKAGRRKPAVRRPKFRPPSQVPPGYVYIWCQEPVAHFEALMGPESWIPTEGFGGWEIVDRPHQVGMVIEGTTPPYQYTGSIMFDGWYDRQSVEDDIKKLLLIAHGDDDNGPGVFSIVGIPDLPAEDWVIEGLEFDPDSVIRHPASMERMRQKVTITMREYVSPHYLRLAPHALKRAHGKYTIIRTKEHDTPHKIAIREHVHVRDIIALNRGNRNFKPPITKANQKLGKNLRIRIPVPENKQHKDRKSRSKSRHHSKHKND